MKNDRLFGVIQLVLVVMVIVVAFGLTRLLKAQKEPVQQTEQAARGLFVTTLEVSPGLHRMRFETTGTVQARTQVAVVPQVAGRIVDVLDAFYAGGYFAADQVLFQIDPRDYNFQVELRSAEVAQAQTSLQLEQAEAEAALAEWRQMNGDKAAPDLVARVPQLAQAAANLKAAQAQLDNARLNLERASYSLPFAGRVLASDLAVGQYVAPGQPYGQVFDVTSLEVEASLSQVQLQHLLHSEDPKITIMVDYLGTSQQYVGRLIRGAASLDAQTRFAVVRFGFQSAPQDVVPGVFVSVEVFGEQVEGVTEIPASALQKDGSVWHVVDDQSLHRLQPEVVEVNGNQLAVRGIDRTVQLVTSRISGATEGTKAILSEAGSTAAEAVGAE